MRHRDTFFRPLQAVRPGDEIRVTSARGTFTYRVRDTRVTSPDDVQVVAKERPEPLAAAIAGALGGKRRTHAATRAIVEERFRPDAVARQYFALYASLAPQ